MIIYSGFKMIVFVIIILGFFIVIIFGVLILIFILKLLKKIVEFFGVIGEGDLIKRVEINLNDEIGEVVNVLNKVKDNIKVFILEIVNSVSDISVVSEELFVILEEVFLKMEIVNGFIE